MPEVLNILEHQSHKELGLDEFATLAKEGEASVNSRLITYVYNDLDSGYPLRPIDFLRPFAPLGSPQLQDENETDEEWTVGNTTDSLHKRWTFTLTLLNSFWKRWQEEYLTSLREQYRQEHCQTHLTSQETLQLDHIALIHDSTKPHVQWKLARIVDRSHHCATLKLPSGQTITRPFNLFYLLELPSSKTKVSEHIIENTTGHPTSSDEKRARKPQRTHPMITRSLKRSASFAFLTIIQLLLSTASADITSYTPPNTKCASRPQTINTIIYPDQCTSQEIAVTTSITKDKKPSFCWLPLYVSTLILVPDLHVRTTEFLHKDDYYCFDHQENEFENRSRTMKQSGTAAFCRRHPCVQPDQAYLFCTYSTEVTTYQANNTSITIKAWSTITRTYYPHKKLPPNTTTPHLTIPQCATGGLQIDTTEKFEMVEICSAHVCIYLSDYEPRSRILLPTSIVLFDYATSIQTRTNGVRQFNATLECKAKPICEVLECTVCWERVYNMQCWTMTEVITATAASLLILIFCRLLSYA
ncbi:hypothetical protein NECAME_10673 [Necator americanus]|uniref:DUF5641 domain-containing protein n=1 Tax=Necator americanus TaxID=51031 RepID=W2TAD5_NECAM|nr:hypothetical protein NECAME_10673 [Necator americanus]ETN77972.1 hypothetical protein NECAME_10673 [Necator americanus]